MMYARESSNFSNALLLYERKVVYGEMIFLLILWNLRATLWYMWIKIEAKATVHMEHVVPSLLCFGVLVALLFHAYIHL